MRRYELMLLLRPDLDDDKLQAAVEKVTRAIVNGGGSLTKVSPWGKRRLAYDIQHFREASYFLIHFDIEPSAVREIERGMLISEEIVRHLVTVLEERPGEQAAEAIEPDAELVALDAVEDDGTADEPAEPASSDTEPEAASVQAEPDEQPQDEQPQVAASEA
jgi:small subunit ribosomal protein S6